MTNLKSRWRALTSSGCLIDSAMLIFGVTACLGLLGYLQIDTGRPARIDADHLFAVTMAKSYINGHGFRFDSQLGYPDTRDWLYFPSFELSYRAFLWLFTRVSHNPFRAAHAMYIAGLTAMFGFTYWMLRRAKVRSWIAAAGAASAMLTSFLNHRVYSHDFLALSFAVPLGLGLAFSIGLARPEVSFSRFWRDPFTWVSVIVVGSSGLYYAFFTIMFLAFAAAAASLGQRRWFPLWAAATAGAVIFGLLIFSGYGLDLPQVLSGRFGHPHRAAHEQLLYGIDLRSMADPFTAIRKVREAVAQAAVAVPSPPDHEGFGEWPALPLTLTLMAAPVIAGVVQSRRRASESATAADRLDLIGFTAAGVVFTLLFGARGGLGFLFNLMLTAEIRADSRLMPFLNVCAVVILCTLAELAADLPRQWMGRSVQFVLVALMLLSMRSSFGLFPKTEHYYLSDPLAQRLQVSVPAMLKVKNQVGLRTVLELPTASWPEAPFSYILDAYEHQLPYIYDTPGSPTRWSYGANDKQPWFGLVSFAASRPEGLVERARLFGFDSVLIQKRGYEPLALAALDVAMRRQLAPSCLLFEDSEELLYALRRDPSGRAC